jgi:hypothetical protein
MIKNFTSFNRTISKVRREDRYFNEGHHGIERRNKGFKGIKRSSKISQFFNG